MINKQKIQLLRNTFASYAKNPGWANLAFSLDDGNKLVGELSAISKDLEAEDLYLSSDMNTISNHVFTLGTFQPSPFSSLVPCYRLNAFQVGALIELLDVLLHSDIISHNIRSNHFEKIFISHRRSDIEQINLFIDLLYAIGIPRPTQGKESVIFCSSYPSSYLDNGEKNLDALRKYLNCPAHTYYILWYTDNFFDSNACLNEAGAIWVKGGKYQEILSPKFDESKIDGLLGRNPIMFRANDKARLNKFKLELEEMFNLAPVELNYWETARDKFIERINNSV